MRSAPGALLGSWARKVPFVAYPLFLDIIPRTREPLRKWAADADEGISGEVRIGVEPGSEFKYSGGGYSLLQLLVEEVTGQFFASYMKEALHYRYTSLAATSLYTSLADLELFFQMHLGGGPSHGIGRGVLAAETLELMRQPHGSTMGLDVWGLGTILFTSTENGDHVVGHDEQSTPAINTAVRLNPRTGNGIIVLTTGHPDLATRVASERVFWKTGKVDTLLFAMLEGGMMSALGMGWLVLVGLGIVVGVRVRGGHRGGRRIASHRSVKNALSVPAAGKLFVPDLRRFGCTLRIGQNRSGRGRKMAPDEANHGRNVDPEHHRSHRTFLDTHDRFNDHPHGSVGLETSC